VGCSDALAMAAASIAVVPVLCCRASGWVHLKPTRSHVQRDLDALSAARAAAVPRERRARGRFSDDGRTPHRWSGELVPYPTRLRRLPPGELRAEHRVRLPHVGLELRDVG